MANKKQIAKAKTIRAIMDAAVQEFAEKGYSGATTRSIAAAAGISNGLIIQYFGSKENLLCTIVNRYELSKLYEGNTDEDPYRIFCVYLDHIRELQRENPTQFKLHLTIIIGKDFPDSIYETIRKGFKGSKVESAIVKAQQSGDLIAGDPFSIFQLLSETIYVLLNRYAAIGAAPPDNDALLNIIGFNRSGKLIHLQKTKISAMENDLNMLMAAIRENYPLSISMNLTKNTYHMIDYDNYSTRKAALKGSFDELIKVGASTIPNEADRRRFVELFTRENLIRAYENGERERSLVHLQTGDDGIDRRVTTKCMMKQNEDGDILAITIGGCA